MTVDPILRAKEVFLLAVTRPIAEQDAEVAAHCGDDRALEAMVRELLRHQRYEPTPLIPAGVASEEHLPERIGRFHVLSVLGEGGMGIVYRAEQRDEVDRAVALKVIKLGMDTRDVVARFDAERQALAAMNHDCIAKVLEVGTTERGQPFFAMELVDGEPITRYCDDRRLTVAERIRLVQRVCAGVQHAHQKGVIHRDLKPGNVLVATDGEVPVPKIVDFGIAKATAGDAAAAMARTASAQILGTPGYMAPEQAVAGAGVVIDARADIYALGVLLYELVVGELPFENEALEGLRSPHRLDAMRDAPRPSTRAAAAPNTVEQRAARRGTTPSGLLGALRGDLDWIALKALAPDPEQRYASAKELAMDLQRHLDDEPVLAGPPSASYRLRKFLRRRRVPVLAGTLIVVALAIGLIAARSARDLAQKRLRDFDRLSYVVRLERAIERQQDLHPAWPQNVPRLQRWLDDDAVQLHLAHDDLRTMLRDIGASGVGGVEAGSSEFLINTLDQLVVDLDAFETRVVPAVQQRVFWARRVEALTIDRFRARWDAARAAILAADDVRASRRYAEYPLDLQPQMGLVPIGMNPKTKLWEFYHLRSAWDADSEQDPAAIEVPTTTDNEQLRLPGRGMTFVLVPGGRFVMGAERPAGMRLEDDPLERGPNEAPIHEVRIAPYLLSRFEMTQGQWARLTGGEYPSRWRIGGRFDGDARPPTEIYPVDSVSWNRCAEVLRGVGLDLPTEAQWERACRAGTSSHWSSGDARGSLEGFANLADQSALAFPPRWGQGEAFVDGFKGPSPIGAFQPNAFGFYDMHGNLWEWCRDWLLPYTRPTATGDGLRGGIDAAGHTKAARGGSYARWALRARSAARTDGTPDYVENQLGVRPARAIR